MQLMDQRPLALVGSTLIDGSGGHSCAGFGLTPTQLCKSVLLTSGAMTNRVDRLESAGLVERLRCPADRRGVLVALTKEGMKLVDRALAAHMKIEEEMLASLSSKDRGKFAALLRALLQHLEPVGTESPSAPETE